MVAVVKALIVAAATAHAVNAGFMLSVAGCESSFNPFATNGPNRGLYQISDFGKAAAFRARDYDNPYDPAQSANFFAEQVLAGQEWAWTCAWQVRLPGFFFLPPNSTSV